MIPVTCFKRKSVALFGLGLSGIASAKALSVGGCEVHAWDDRQTARDAAFAAGLDLSDLQETDWSKLEALVLAPGVPLTHPEPHWTVSRAQAAGVEIIGDTELFFRERAALRSESRVVAITGTNGKSTTAALTAHVLRTADIPTSLGGNIGRAILDLEPFSDERVYVVEFSSYQIDLTPHLNATAAALLNITPDHLDRHGDMANYARVKSGIFSGLQQDGVAVVSVDDEYSKAIADDLEGRLGVRRVSIKKQVRNGVFVEDRSLVRVIDGERQPAVPIGDAVSLRGTHNAQNAGVTLALTEHLGLHPNQISAGFASFPGLEHRMQEVGRSGPVLFINDSKATNADAAAHALSSFDDIFWIAGGQAKTGGIESLDPYFPRIRCAYLIGEAAKDFAQTLDGKVDTVLSETMDEAVRRAAMDAAASGASEPAVLLSPACASFDQYRSFMERGEAFRAAVARVPGVVMNTELAA